MPKREGRRTIDLGKVLAGNVDRAAKEDGYSSFAELVRFLLRDYLDKRLPQYLAKRRF